jgi:hypothetical protein
MTTPRTGDENGGVSMDVDIDIPDDQDTGAGDTEILPMSVSGGIESLRYVRSYMLECRSGVEAGDKDGLLEESRRQRAAT